MAQRPLFGGRLDRVVRPSQESIPFLANLRAYVITAIRRSQPVVSVRRGSCRSSDTLQLRPTASPRSIDR